MKNFYTFSGKGLPIVSTLIFSKNYLFTFILFCGFTMNLTAQTILMVNSTNDNSDVNLSDGVCADQQGNCTLRAAIETSNQTSETDEVRFDLRGKSPFIFTLTKDLPVITETIFLNATTLKGYSWSSPAIVIDGAGVARFGFKLEGQSSGSVIKGFVMGGFNIIDEGNILNNGTAIYANETGSHLIEGNFLGVTPDGTTAFPNMFGVALVNSSGNKIGGMEANNRNIISGNYVRTGWGIGIYIHGSRSSNNTILGNYIGTDVTSTRAIPNYWGVVTHEGANGTLIGGTGPESRNIISGNIRSGVYILSPDNIVSGNYIGIDKDGKILADMGESSQEGVRLWSVSASGNTIGGLTPGERNVISGNIYFNAITMGSLGFDMVGNKILGNYLGTDPSGQYKVPNYRGISMTTNSATVANNVISGNQTFGLQIHSSTGVQVYNNLIGTTADGVSPLGNRDFGIRIVNGSENNYIGSSSSDEGNIIAHNQAGGVLISYFDNIGSQVTTQPLKNTVGGNKIFGNANIGIDLDSNGISENDLGDNDEGANFLQNFPEFFGEASVIDQVLSLSYIVPSDPNFSTYPIKVEFFKSDGNRQGKYYLITDVFSELDYTNGKEKSIQASLPSGVVLAPGDYIVATATDANGNTSEFSDQVQVVGDCTPQTWYVDADSDTYGVDSPDTNISSCTQPEGNYVTRAGDCDDNISSINPEAEDIPDDGIDQDCDGSDTTTGIVDTDGDGIADSVDNCPTMANPNQADANGNGVGDACEGSTCLGTDVLNLTDCTSGSNVYWTVHNPGDCSVDVSYEIRKSSESGSFSLNPGDSYQFSTAVASKGQTQLILYWNDSTGNLTQLQSNASGSTCSATAATLTGSAEKEVSNEAPSTYPNPVGDNGFTVSFPEALGGKIFNARVYDLNSYLIGSRSFDVPTGGADILWNIDTTGWIPGVYILQLENGSESHQVNLLKE